MRSSMEAGPPSGVMHRMSKHLLQAVRIAALLVVATICGLCLAAPGPNTHAHLAPADGVLITSNQIAGFNNQGRDFSVYLPQANGTCPSQASKPIYRSCNRPGNVNDGGHRCRGEV